MLRKEWRVEREEIFAHVSEVIDGGSRLDRKNIEETWSGRQYSNN
jgi:hypothetical protein